MGRIVGRKRTTSKGKQQQGQQTAADGSSQPAETVHRRNVHLFAQPVILAFHVIRFLAFQLWLLLSLAYRVGSVVVASRPQTSSEPVQIGATAEQDAADAETRRTSSSSTSSVVEMTRLGAAGSPGRAAAGPSAGGGGYTLRPGAPVLAQQKHHHRKAFEYISKALKLDEDGKGLTASSCCFAFNKLSFP